MHRVEEIDPGVDTGQAFGSKILKNLEVRQEEARVHLKYWDNQI